MENNIEALRNILFDAIRGVKAGTLDIEKAKVIDGLSQTIINSAKVEVEYMRNSKKPTGTNFLLVNDADEHDGDDPKIEDDLDEQDLSEDQKDLLALGSAGSQRTTGYMHFRGMKTKQRLE